MKTKMIRTLLLASAFCVAATSLFAAPSVSGELKQWHKVTLTLDGPQAKETDTEPNPFTDYRMDVTFTHESGTPSYKVPGYSPLTATRAKPRLRSATSGALISRRTRRARGTIPCRLRAANMRPSTAAARR